MEIACHYARSYLRGKNGGEEGCHEKSSSFLISREEPARRLARSEGKLVDNGNLPKCPAIVLGHQMPIFPEPLCHGNEKKKPSNLECLFATTTVSQVFLLYILLKYKG